MLVGLQPHINDHQLLMTCQDHAADILKLQAASTVMMLLLRIISTEGSGLALAPWLLLQRVTDSLPTVIVRGQNRPHPEAHHARLTADVLLQLSITACCSCHLLQANQHLPLAKCPEGAMCCNVMPARHAACCLLDAPFPPLGSSALQDNNSHCSPTIDPKHLWHVTCLQQDGIPLLLLLLLLVDAAGGEGHPDNNMSSSSQRLTVLPESSAWLPADLSVVHAEGHAQHILGVPDKAASGATCKAPRKQQPEQQHDLHTSMVPAAPLHYR
jgi:hypothetical protein